MDLLAGRVWLFPHHSDPDVIRGLGGGDRRTKRGSVVVDAGNSPDAAREVQAAIAGRPGCRIRAGWCTRITTGTTPGVPAPGGAGRSSVTRPGLPILAAEARRPWSHRYLRDEAAANPRLGPSFRARARPMPSWDGFAVRPPNRTFDDTLPLPTGVELRHVGGGHAEDSADRGRPRVRRSQLLGDCFYPPPFHLRGEDDTTDFAMVRRLLAERLDWYVDAHSAPREGLSAR